MSAPLIIVQFSMSNATCIPTWVPWHKYETGAESNRRVARSAASAKQNAVLPPVDRCAVDSLLNDLCSADYYMVSAWRQTRQHRNHVGAYHALRYTFAHEAFSKLADLRATYPMIEDDFLDFIGRAFWRARAFLNPGSEPGTSMLSINLEHREPIDTRECLKDADGNKIGKGVLIQPRATLHLGQDLKISAVA